jgi:hypothetical protein
MIEKWIERRHISRAGDALGVQQSVFQAEEAVFHGNQQFPERGQTDAVEPVVARQPHLRLAVP